MSLGDTSSNGRIDRYPHPFTEKEEGHLDAPRTLIELRMCALSAAIREKDNWHVKLRDQVIQSKWREEIEEQQVGLRHGLKLTNNMINYVMTELEAYAALRDPNTGIEVGPYERVWISDTLIPASLKTALLDAVLPLESVPDDQKDWHPGSDGKVLDLVHPSLYPVVYGRSTDTRSGQPVTPRPVERKVHSQFTSARFQWLPSDFAVAADGSVRLASPYINNVHPADHAALARVLPRLLECAVPMFERVLSDLARAQLPTRLDGTPKGYLGVPECVWNGVDRVEPDAEQERELEAEISRLEDEDERKEEEARERGEEYETDSGAIRDAVRYAWYDRQPKNWPDSKPQYDGMLEAVRKTVDLRGKSLQVIVKLANIVLTPEQPVYSGGKWHVEGMNNEAIVASFIYYYNCENITESTLSFRNAVREPDYHEQDDDYCMKRLYGIDRDDICVQEVGKAVTKQDRCLAFPNLYQHLVSPFRLADPAKPGHRNILVFFLVDPAIRIPSASDVGPQQAAWLRRAVEGTALWARLPVELRDMVWEHVGAMGAEEALKYREELMEERTRFVDVVDGERFGMEFNMCEH